ncbi:MAG: glycosyltransferase [Patescibacteria group bacterium]|nr:glycosyltransferase [Patescibacteria group bacterium]
MDNLPKQAVMLLITSQDWGGAQLYVFELAKELKARGESVIVVAGKNPSKSPLVMGDLLTGLYSPHDKGGMGGCTGSELSAKCLAANIPFYELKHMSRDINPLANVFATIELIKLFRRLKPRVVHLNSTMMGVVGSLSATLTRVPKRIYCIGGWVFNEELPGWKKSLYVWIERVSAKWKDVIIVVHPGDEELAIKLKIKPQKKLVTIPNGVDVARFESKLLTREEARLKLGADPDATLVGTIANAYPPKNLLWYLEVCKKIHDADKRIYFVIIGDGPQFEILKKKRAELDAESYVMLAGRRMDAPTLYKAFDLFVLPSSKEGMSITLLEAMTAKVPIVATDVGAGKWMLRDCGIIVPPNDAVRMQTAVLDILQNKDKQKSITQNAYAMLLANFEQKKLLDTTVEVINE